MKIELPTELRERIQSTKDYLAGQIAGTDNQRAQLATERAELEGETTKLAGEITALKVAALRDSGAAEKLPGCQTRYDLMSARLMQIRGEQDSFKPVTLAVFAPVLVELICHYQQALPAVFLRHNRMFFAHEQDSATLLKFLPAYRILPRIRNMENTMARVTAQSDHAPQILEIFERALRGEPYLGPGAAENPAGTTL